MTSEYSRNLLALALIVVAESLLLAGILVFCVYNQGTRLTKCAEQIKRYEQVEYAYINLLNRVQQPAVCLSCGSISIEHKDLADVFKKVEGVLCPGMTNQTVKQGSGK